MVTPRVDRSVFEDAGEALEVDRPILPQTTQEPRSSTKKRRLPAGSALNAGTNEHRTATTDTTNSVTAVYSINGWDMSRTDTDRGNHH